MRPIRILVAALCVVMFAVPATGGVYRHGRKPIPNRYIVVLNDEVPAGMVQGLSQSLAESHGGKLLAVMKDGIKAFGVVMTESRARALMHHPAVAMVEEDEQMEFADSSSQHFDFRTVASRITVRPAANNCPWSGSYYLCQYFDDTYWNLDRLDNLNTVIYSNKAYAYMSTGQGVRAYLVDTGVYRDHIEFDTRVEAGANMTVDPDIGDPITRPDEELPIVLDGSPADLPCNGWLSDASGRPGHGTAVASVLGGTYSGVAKNVTIVPVKVMTCGGVSAKLAMARGLDWVYSDMSGRQGRAVVNMSMFIDTTLANQNGILEGAQVCEDGFGGYTNCVSAIEHVVSKLIKPKASGGMNVPVVVSANNRSDGECRTAPARMGYGNEAAFPSSYRTITVGGSMYTINQQGYYVDQRWTCAATPQGCDPQWISFHGYGLGSNYGPCVSIWAPAANIRVAGASGPASYRPLGGPSSGTSFSAPYVAGIVARLLEVNPNLSANDIWSALRTRADYRCLPGSAACPADFDPSAVVNKRLAYISPYE